MATDYIDLFARLTVSILEGLVVVLSNVMLASRLLFKYKAQLSAELKQDLQFENARSCHVYSSLALHVRMEYWHGLFSDSSYYIILHSLCYSHKSRTTTIIITLCSLCFSLKTETTTETGILHSSRSNHKGGQQQQLSLLNPFSLG